MAAMQTTRSLPRNFRLISQLWNTRRQSTAVEATGKWQIVGAACITRPPVVCPPMTPLEAQYSEMLATVEKELSLKSNHELRHEQDLMRVEFLKSGDTEEVDIEEASKQTALEFEDICTEEFKAFTPAPITTEADEKNDLSSLNRALERSLILVVKQKLGSDHQWVLPQAPWVPGETLRQTCERVVRETCGTSLKVKFLGNAPCGYYKYKFPKQARKDGFIGAKVFFYKGMVREASGNVQPGQDVIEHQWLSQDQLDERLKRSYADSVSRFLVSDK